MDTGQEFLPQPFLPGRQLKMLLHGKYAYWSVGLFQRCSLSLTLFMRCPSGTLFTPQCARGVWSGKPSPSLSQCSRQNLLCVKYFPQGRGKCRLGRRPLDAQILGRSGDFRQETALVRPGGKEVMSVMATYTIIRIYEIP